MIASATRLQEREEMVLLAGVAPAWGRLEGGGLVY